MFYIVGHFLHLLLLILSSVALFHCALIFNYTVIYFLYANLQSCHLHGEFNQCVANFHIKKTVRHTMQ